MELQIACKNMELSLRVRTYIERKLGKLNRHLPNIMDTRVEIIQEKTRSRQQHFVARVSVSGKGIQFHGEERGEDPMVAIDKVTDVMVRQLEDFKGKTYEKKGTSSARFELVEETETEQPAPTLVKTKRFVIKPMSVEEAADQMELLGHNFFLFRNADTEAFNVLYRRKDGNYGLIEAEPS